MDIQRYYSPIAYDPTALGSVLAHSTQRCGHDMVIYSNLPRHRTSHHRSPRSDYRTVAVDECVPSGISADSIPTLFCCLSSDPSRHWSESRGTVRLLICTPSLLAFTQPVQPLYSNPQEKQHPHGTRTHTQPLDNPDEVESFGRYSWPGLMLIQVSESRSSAPIHTIKNAHSHT